VKPKNQKEVIVMIQQTVFPFKIETTKERLTAHGGLALMAEFKPWDRVERVDRSVSAYPWE